MYKFSSRGMEGKFSICCILNYRQMRHVYLLSFFYHRQIENVGITSLTFQTDLFFSSSASVTQRVIVYPVYSL